MGSLSRLTGDPRFESAALRALRQLWRMRSSLDLLGTTLDVVTGEWIEYSSSIGAGMLFIQRDSSGNSFSEELAKTFYLYVWNKLVP